MNMFVTVAKNPWHLLIVFLVVACCTVSCSTVKDYPNKPFVYNTNIELSGKFSTDERKDLLAQLGNYLHDSIGVRRKQFLFFWNTLQRPPAYDSTNADLSVIYMRGLLNSLGYYRDSITYDTTLKVVRSGEATQYRTTVHFDVTPGKLIKLNDITYNFENDTLQKIAQATRDTLQQITNRAQAGAVIRQGTPFSKSLIATELDRLTDIYRNSGYLRFSREELLAVYDTVGIALLQPTLDPIEQAQQLEELRRRRENPIADLEIRLRANPDTMHVVRYHVGNVTIYPDLTIDTADYIRQESRIGDYRIVSYQDLYKPRVLAENIYLRRGDLYSQRNYLRTLNRFNSIGSWRLVNIEQIPRPLTDTVDFVVRLTPADKYSMNANLEGSQNFSSTVLTSGNIVGVNVGLQNRNFAQGANLATTNFRFATGLGRRRLTKQISFGHTISFPRLMPPFRFIPAALRDNFRTVLNFNSSYTSLKDFYKLTTVNGSWGYTFNWRNKLLAIRFLNIEYGFLVKGDSLLKLIETNRSYEYIFNSGLVTSTILNFTIKGGQGDIANLKRFNLEYSGLLTGLIRSDFLDRNLHRFVKLDAEFSQNHKIRRSAFAWRIFAGAGYQLRSDRFRFNTLLPFFKSYYAGGANSMRAWALRKLGPGSAIRSFALTTAPERFGDMQLEANAEYRFYITQVAGVTINSTLYTDIGNIWTIRKIPGFENGHFRADKLWHDIAIGTGTGLRVDFGFFLLRLDYAYKVKDPSPDALFKQNKWFYNWKLFNGQIQLGVTYPF